MHKDQWLAYEKVLSQFCIDYSLVFFYQKDIISNSFNRISTDQSQRGAPSNHWMLLREASLEIRLE